MFSQRSEQLALKGRSNHNFVKIEKRTPTLTKLCSGLFFSFALIQECFAQTKGLIKHYFLTYSDREIAKSSVPKSSKDRRYCNGDWLVREI